ncbi:MAG: S8 family serine peptidase [Deltaproteobacteria bacterium]|nr:S8 family serine peptidase [Deltaproteobacteria bacterium]
MRVARFLPLAVLCATLPFITGLEACLGLCDFESDPSCEDPERAQVQGSVTVPEGGSAAHDLPGALRPIEPGFARALADAVTSELAALPRTGVAPTKGARRPHQSSANWVDGSKTRVEHFRPGEVIVRALEPVRERKAELSRALAIELESSFGKDAIVVDVRLCGTPTRCLADLRTPAGKPLDPEATAEAVLALSRSPLLAYAEKNLILQAAAQPNDEFFTLQWHYAAMDLPAAWDITQGSDDVTAVIIDTGILVTHPDLEERVTTLGADLIDDPEVAKDGDGRDDDGDDVGDQACGSDCHSFHGSHVAGTMGAVTDNGAMVAGVSWAGRIIPARALGAGGGSLADIADAIEWAVGNDVDGVNGNPYPADVINMSLGGYGESQAMNDAVADAVAAGAIVVVAAGNDNTDASEFTPANAPDAITVASHGNTGTGRATPRKASYSNFGDRVDVAAPGGEQGEDIDGDGQGDGVLSTVEDFVVYYQGTSMAAPHVAGVAMLLKSLDPDMDQEQARQLLTSTASPDLDCPEGCGAGRVSAARAVHAVGGDLDGPFVIASPSVLRVGRGQVATPVIFKNIGAAGTDVDLRVGGDNRADCALDRSSATLGPDETVVASVDITRNEAADDRGECTVTATFGSQSAEARIVWTPDEVQGLTVVDVGAVRIDDDGALSVERIVTTSAVQQFEYKLFNLSPGDYLVVGLVDVNSDGDYDDDVDAIGIYQPRGGDDDACTQSSCGRLTVTVGDHVTGADFTVAPGFGGGDDDTGGTGDGDLGDGCAASNQCGGGLYCEASLPGGYCTTDCAGDADCPNSGLCFSLVDATGEEYTVCLQSCAAPSDCRTSEGYTCDADSTCYPGG